MEGWKNTQRNHVSSNHINWLFALLVSKILVFSCLFFPPIQQAFGQNDTQITIDGLTFSCPECAVLRDGLCRLNVFGEPMAIKCSPDARSLLLEYLLHRSYAGVNPSREELYRFILKEAAAKQDVQRAIALLLQSREGSALLQREGRFLFANYPTSLSELLKAGQGDYGFWMVVATSAVQDLSAEQIKLRLLFSERFQQSDWKALRSSLAYDFDLDHDFLDRVYRVAENEQLESASLFKAIMQFMDNCAAQADEHVAAKCSAAGQQSLAAVWRNYLNKGYAQRLTKAFRHGHLSAQDFIRLLAQTDYRQGRSGDLLKGLSDAFRLVLKSPVSGREKIWEQPGARELFAFAQEHEHSLADFAAGQKGAAFSFWAGLVVLLPLLVLFGVGVYGYFLWLRQRRIADEMTNKRLTKYYSELRELLSYFAIDVNATEEDLAKSYRQMAKRVHPDVDAQGTQKFSELKAKYDRARELLDKFHSA